MSYDIKSFRDLNIYKASYDAALKMHKISLSFPRSEQMVGMADQLRRATKSIPANIAEGFGKQVASPAEFKRYLSIALGSSDEVKVWLEFAKDLDYISIGRYNELFDEYVKISKMMNSLYNKWKKIIFL